MPSHRRVATTSYNSKTKTATPTKPPTSSPGKAPPFYPYRRTGHQPRTLRLQNHKRLPLRATTGKLVRMSQPRRHPTHPHHRPQRAATTRLLHYRPSAEKRMRKKLCRTRQGTLGRFRDPKPLGARRQDPLKKPQPQLHARRTESLPDYHQSKPLPGAVMARNTRAMPKRPRHRIQSYQQAKV